MASHSVRRAAGTAAIIGGILGVVLAPIMVIVKYQTGWSIVPEPSWIAVVTPLLGGLLQFATPVTRWTVYGSMYSVALLLMFAGLFALASEVAARAGRRRPKGLWIAIVGLCLVILGDAVHTATWHQHGLTVPTPGTNPIANTGYAVHMMGMNVILVGTLAAGISSLRNGLLARWLAWSFVLIAPSMVVITLTILPTTPSDGLWMFSAMMIIVGCSLSVGKPVWRTAA